MALPDSTFRGVPDILTDAFPFAIDATFFQRAIGPPGLVVTVKLTVKECRALSKHARYAPRFLKPAGHAIQHLKAVGRLTARMEQRSDFTTSQDCAF